MFNYGLRWKWLARELRYYILWGYYGLISQALLGMGAFGQGNFPLVFGNDWNTTEEEIGTLGSRYMAIYPGYWQTYWLFNQ